MEKALAAIEKAVVKRLRKDKPKGTKALDDVVGDQGFWDAQQGVFLGGVGEQPEALLGQGVAQAQRLGLAIDFELVNQGVLDFAGKYKDDWWGKLEKTTRQGLRKAIKANIKSGAPLRSLEKDIAPLFGKERAKVIATTEVTRLVTEGNLIAYRDAGVTEVEFQTVGDALVDPDCAELDGKTFPINKVAIHPPIHVNCRCDLAPVAPTTGETLTKPA